MFATIALFLSLTSAPAAPAPGPVFASCEWHTDSVSGISTEVCDGRAVAWKDGQGNYDVARYSRR